MYNPIFDSNLQPSWQAQITELLQCISESISPTNIRLYAYRIGNGCFHVLNLDDQFEITVMEGIIDIPDRKNCLDYIRVGHLQVTVTDSVDIVYFIAAVVEHFKSTNRNLTFSVCSAIN